MIRRRRLPNFKNAHYWALGAILAGALFLLRLELDQLWPASPLWIRSLMTFGAASVIGEIWVSKYWPLLRTSSTESRDVLVGLVSLVVTLTVVIVLVDMFAEVELPLGPIAWTYYMSYLLFDASYQW